MSMNQTPGPNQAEKAEVSLDKTLTSLSNTIIYVKLFKKKIPKGINKNILALEASCPLS